MAQDISGLYISQSFQNLVQRSASGAFNILATATGTEFIPVSASYAISASYALTSEAQVSASYAESASFVPGSGVSGPVSQSEYAEYANSTIVFGKNLEATTITKGTPLYFTASGTSGNLVGVYRADAGNVNRMPAGGIAGQDIASAAEGRVLLDGFINGVDTSTFGSGDQVYVGVGGGYTNVAPTGSSNLIQVLGNIEKSAINGSGVIQMAGESRQMPNIQAGYAWVGDSNGVAQPTPTSSFVSAPPNLQEVLTTGNSASVDLILSASLIQSGSNFSVHSDNITFRNSASSGPELIILDEQNDSFSVGPKIKFSGSNVGIIETQRNLKIDVVGGGDTVFNAGNQYLFQKNDFSSGDFKITDYGSRTAFYKHENLNETGSITFANTTTDVGIGIIMDDDQMALQMYSGSGFVPIIRRPSGSRDISIYDSTFSTGSSGQVLSSNAQGGIEWVAGGGGGAAFPYTGSAQITGSLSVTGSVSVGNSSGNNTISNNGSLVAGSSNNLSGQNGVILGGTGHTNSGETSVIIGGENNTINSSYVGIFGAAAATITNGDTAVIVGGYQMALQGSRTYLLGGNDNQITNAGADFSGIIGGQTHRISTAVTASAIIGGKAITATKNETVYVPALEVVSGGINITGSAVNKVNTITVASLTASIDCNLSNTFQFVAGAANTHVIATNINAGQVINVQVTQDAGGAGTLTFDSAFKWPGGTAPTLTASPNAIDLISAVSYDGTTLISNATQNYS